MSLRREVTEGFDPGKLRFPSDAITIGQMRAEEPAVFAGLTTGKMDSIGIDALALHHYELDFAENAYARAAGLPEPKERDAEHRRWVVRDYIKYGVAKGRHEARRMLEELERQAAALADSRGAGGRPR